MNTRKLSTLSNDASIDQVVEVIKRDGGVIISDFVSPTVLKSLANELDTYLNATPFGVDPTSRVLRLAVSPA